MVNRIINSNYNQKESSEIKESQREESNMERDSKTRKESRNEEVCAVVESHERITNSNMESQTRINWIKQS